MLRVIGLLLAPAGVVAAAEYEVWAHGAWAGWHVLDGLLTIVLVTCAIGIVAAQPDKKGGRR